MTTKEQQAIIETNERHVVVTAGAGCGKTYTIVERVHELLAGGVQPCAIVVLTFSRAAAKELKQRIGERGVHVGTFHSFLVGLIHPRPNVLSQEESDALIVECAMATGLATISKNKLKPLKGNMAQWQREAHGRWPTALGKYYASQLAIRGDIDYSGILLEGIKMADRGEIAPEYLIVDEAQDNDLTQWTLTKKIAERCSVFAVGDENQCQPPGTMVRIAERLDRRNSKCIHRDIPIEQVKPGDKAVAYGYGSKGNDRHFYAAGRDVQAVASRHYTGDLIEIETYDKRSRYTEDHICIIKMKDGFFGKHFVYLMRKGGQFRIGKAIGLENGASKSRFGFMARATAEGADAIWLLKAYEDNMAARMDESILSLEYGIPQLMWKNNHSKNMASQEHLDEFWSRYKVDPKRAEALLRKFKRKIEYPLWTRGQPGLIGKRVVTVRACNLMEGMHVLCADTMGINPKVRRWLPFEIKRIPYDGPVYSLQVDAPNTYVADGIVTHNCVHQWRGATPEAMMELPWLRLPLTETFRCHQAIVDEANSIEGITLKLRTSKSGGNVIKSDAVSPDDVIGLLGNNKIEDVAVLCRYNTDVDWWTEVMEREGVMVAQRGTHAGALHWLLRWLCHPTSNTARQKASMEMAPYRPQHDIFLPLFSSRSTDSVGELAKNWLGTLGVSYGPAEIFDALKLPDMLWSEAKAIAEAYRGETLDWYFKQELMSTGIEKQSPGLNIRTVHSAKGLEWDAVVMPRTPKDYRLNYVGTTRAKTLLIKGPE